jgi:ubiquitin C-terminal hydrolase
LIDFPIDNLDLSKYSSTGKEKYKLYAVCYHHGNINSGNYTTVCKINNNWFEFNDKYIKEYNQEQIVTEDAYILFYKQKRKII